MIAVDEGGDAYAIWTDQRNGNADIYFAYRPAGGEWGANVKLNDDPETTYQTYPDLAVDANGNAYAVCETGAAAMTVIICLSPRRWRLGRLEHGFCSDLLRAYK